MPSTSDRPTTSLTATRTIGAPPAVVFAVLSDPSRHHETEPGDMVRDAIAAEPLTAVGQRFEMNMFHDTMGGAYVMSNEVIALEPDRTIAWAPALLEDGRRKGGGFFWRYDLAPIDDDRTEVSLTYDWEHVTAETVERTGEFPHFSAAFLAASLASLARAVEGPATR